MSSLYLFLYNRLKASETTRGLVAGATGTGKTITMQVLAESFSNAGVPVFVTDIKGDVSGMALEGQDKGWQKKRAERIEFESFEFQASPVMFWGFFGEFGHPVRATVSEVGPFLLSRMLDLTEAQEGVINIAFKLSDEEGLPAREKFTSSVERMIKTIDTFCQGDNKADSLDQFFGHYLLASTMRNGDAHLKNFGLIYDQIQTPRLAPVYDMLSMSVYAPTLPNARDADDGMAINFQGSKRWLRAEMIETLATRCLVRKKRSRQWQEQIAAALVQTSELVLEHLSNYPDDNFTSQADRMLELWAIGLETFDTTAAHRVAKNRPQNQA
jgi:hypothetical protein